MKTDMSEKFDKVSDIKKEAEQKRIRMMRDRDELKSRKDTINEEV